MRFTFILLLIFVMSLNLFSQVIDIVEFELYATINNGSKDNELLYDKNVMPKGPTAISIQNDKFFIADSLNYRLVIYDQNFNFIKLIKNETYSEDYIFFPYTIKLDSKENIYLSQPFGFLKIKMNGVKSYYIEREQSILKEQEQDKFYIVNDMPYFYGKKELFFIANNGVIEKNVTKNIEHLNTFSTSEVNTKALGYFNNNIVLLNDNFFIPKDYKHFKEYSESLKSNGMKNKKILNNHEYSINNLIGIDKEGNYYWIGYDAHLYKKRYIFIFSKYGDLITSFENTYSLKVTLSDEGDLFFLKSTEEGHYIYKITRRW